MIGKKTTPKDCDPNPKHGRFHSPDLNIQSEKEYPKGSRLSFAPAGERPSPLRSLPFWCIVAPKISTTAKTYPKSEKQDQPPSRRFPEGRESQDMAAPKTATGLPAQIINETRALLEFHRALGIHNYPATPALRDFIKAPAPQDSPEDERLTARQVRRPATKESVKTNSLADIQASMQGCTRCFLHKSCGTHVFGEGNPRADLMIIGPAPSPARESEKEILPADTDELLAKMLKAIGLGKEDVYLTTLVKCRPTSDGLPDPEAVRGCLPILLEQIASVAPTVICTLGPLAAQTLLQTEESLLRLRGRFHPCQDRQLLATFDPGYLMRNPDMKRAAWQDLQMIQRKLDRR